MIIMKDKIKYYSSYEDDFIHQKDKDIKLKDNYKWIHNNIFYNFFSYIFYFIFSMFSLITSKILFHTTIKNKKILKKGKNYFLYINHTLPFGDVINPFIINFPKRPCIIANVENLKIPVIGKFIPFFGGLVIPKDIHSMQKFMDSIDYYYQKNRAIIIYPEAHVWPYCSFIRPFASTSFEFVRKNNAPVYTATTTFHKRKFSKKPKVIIYINGPFYIDKSLETKKAQVKDLSEKVYNQMETDSKNNTYQYIKYLPKD